MKALVFDVNVEEIIHLIQDLHETKEAYLGEHSPISMQEIPDAAVQFPDWLVIQTRLTGICGSDYKQVFIDFENIDSPMAACATFPQVMGHEVVGTIAAVGPEVTDRHVGQRVVLNPWLSCAPRGITPICPMCREGQFSLCQNFRHGRLAAGIHTGTCRDASGGFAPMVPAHHSMAIPLPDDVTDEQAVLADPFSVSLHSVLRYPPKAGEPRRRLRLRHARALRDRDPQQALRRPHLRHHPLRPPGEAGQATRCLRDDPLATDRADHRAAGGDHRLGHLHAERGSARSTDAVRAAGGARRLQHRRDGRESGGRRAHLPARARRW
jgi:hypothetical protein